MDEAEEPRSNHELLTMDRTILFLRDAGVGRNIVTQKRTQSIIDAKFRQRRAVSFNDFLSLTNDLLPLEESVLNTNTLQNFVNNYIRPNYF